MLEAIRSTIRELLEQRSGHETDIDKVIADAEARGDGDLDTAEQAAFESARAAIAGIDAELDQARARESDLVAEQATRDKAAALRAQYPPLKSTTAQVVGGVEPEVYTKDSARRGVSFFADLASAAAGNDYTAADRLRRHATMAPAETRAVGTGAFAGLIVPQYLDDLAAPLRRAGRPTADIANKHPLPESGTSMNISRLTTGTSVASQATENTAVSETNVDDTLLTVPVRTIAGMQNVSFQAIERGTGADTIIHQDLLRAYNTELDRQVINGSGATGEHLGIRLTAGILSVAYTDASPTAAELFPKLADLIQQIQTATFMGVTHFVMHPRRWWWFAKELGTVFPLLSFPSSPERAGNAGGPEYEGGFGRNIMGVPVVVDANIPTNLGAGTNEDVILGVTDSELHLWEDADSPTLIRCDCGPGITSLQVTFVLYGYSAFTAGRVPNAHGTIGGTGIAPPAF